MSSFSEMARKQAQRANKQKTEAKAQFVGPVDVIVLSHHGSRMWSIMFDKKQYNGDPNSHFGLVKEFIKTRKIDDETRAMAWSAKGVEWISVCPLAPHATVPRAPH